MSNVVLVTGGSGLVGKAIQHVIETEPEGSRYGRLPGETWIFARSAEGDLRYLHPYNFFISNESRLINSEFLFCGCACVGTPMRRMPSSISTNLRM
jgi:hypothetical protein